MEIDQVILLRLKKSNFGHPIVWEYNMERVYIFLEEHDLGVVSEGKWARFFNYQCNRGSC